MLEGKGKYWRTDNKLYIYVPVQVANDSAFPFTGENGHVKVRIDGDRLVIEGFEEKK